MQFLLSQAADELLPYDLHFGTMIHLQLTPVRESKRSQSTDSGIKLIIPHYITS